MENRSVDTSWQPVLGSAMPVAPAWRLSLAPSYYLAIAAALIIAWLIQSKRRRCDLNAPLYKASKTKWIFSAESLVKDSYRKFQDKVYQIRGTEGPQLVLPSNYVAELKTLPEDVLSAKEAVADALQSKYTKFSPGHNSELLTLLLRTRLTQNLVKLAPQLQEELEYIVATEFPACDDWTPVKWHPFALRAVTRLTGRAFVGPDNRQEGWMDTSINFAVHVFMAGAKLQLFPEWARPLAQYLVSDLGKIRRDIDAAKAMIAPVLEQRISDLDVPGCEPPPNDMMQWLIEALPDHEKADVQTQAELQLVTAAASIHTTHGLLCECIYDLAAHPEIQDELREEARQVLDAAAGGWTRVESMGQLRKMDSFMREVQRLRGNIVSFLRKVMKPISLSDGTHLPAGTRVVAPLAGIAHDERFFPDADRFDPLRFYHLRQQSPEANSRLQFTSIGDTYVNFGAGRHACAGRFFAGNEIKLVLAHFVLGYDIRLRRGEQRPKPMSIVMTKSPSPNAVLEFRRRQP